MASSTGTPDQVIAQLNSARKYALESPTVYAQVVPGVLGVIGPNAHLELRRWGSDFLAETFASPVLQAESKQNLCLAILDTLRGYVNRKEDNGEEEDSSVIKSAVQCAASIYPLVFRHVVVNAGDSETWAKMTDIKSSILRRMDTAPAGVRICCIKFVARVVQVQTPGLIADPRRPEQNEISLALVPRDHAVMPPVNLEAEAIGLLDRLLGVLQDNLTDALVVTATLNALSTLVQRRASISTKILMTVLNFNPLRLAGAHMAGKDKIAIKSMTRTTMSFLLNVLKRNPNHALAARLQQQTERLRHSLAEVFSEAGPGKRKQEADEPTDGLDDAKRRRIEESATNGTMPQQQQHPPLPPGPVTVAQLFTLSRDPNVAGFHVGLIPPQTVTQLVPPLLQSIDQRRLDDAINAVRARFLDLSKRPPASAADAARAVTGEDEDDDYDPSMGLGNGHDQVMNRLDQLPPEGMGDDIALGPFSLPPAPPLTEAQRDEYSKMALERVFGTLADLDREARAKSGKKAEVEKGFNRLAAGGAGHDREGWITLVTRLATRTPFHLNDDDENGKVKKENNDQTITKKGQHFDLANGIRQALMNYVMEDFRRRIDVAISWLNEEWYSDRLTYKSKSTPESPPPTIHDLPNYTHHTLAFLDSLITYLDVKDGRFLIRCLSELPQLGIEMLERVKKVAEDPERVQIATQALLYLIMFRPPVRELCVDVAESIWRENEDAKAAVGKVLAKWRPEVLKEVVKGEEGSESVKVEA